jgi:hypothetical protein
LTLNDSVSRGTTARTELEEYVHQFVEQNGLQHRLEILLFGARLARDKQGALRRYEDEITQPEKDLIRMEKDKSTGFWKQAKFFKATSMIEMRYRRMSFANHVKSLQPVSVG